MLLPANYDDEIYKIVPDGDGGYFLHLVTVDMLRSPGESQPIWYTAAADERSFILLIRWVCSRRACWQEWGALAERIGHDTFDRWFQLLVEADPPSEAVANFVNKIPDDPCGVSIGELLAGSGSTPTLDELCRHRFGTPEERDLFYLALGEDLAISGELVTIAFKRGTDALSRRLEEIVARRRD